MVSTGHSTLNRLYAKVLEKKIFPVFNSISGCLFSVPDSQMGKGQERYTLSCVVFIKNSIAVKGYSLGYIYELFGNLDNSQMCHTDIEPQDNYFASWVKLATGKSDILIINALRDTVPEIFLEEVVSSIPINPSDDILVVEKSNNQFIQIFNHWFTFFKHTPEYKELSSKFFRSYRSMD